jgi:hypothetical protein
MTEVEITVTNAMRDEYLEVSASGSLADALRNCVMRLGDRYAADPAMQRLAEAVASVDTRSAK